MKLFLSMTVGLVLLILLIGQFGLRLIYSYDIRDGAIRVVLFSVFPVVRFPILNVVSVTRASRKGLWLNPWYALRLGNRIFGDAVLIRRRQGLIKLIVITPDDPDRFIDGFNSLKRHD